MRQRAGAWEGEVNKPDHQISTTSLRVVAAAALIAAGVRGGRIVNVCHPADRGRSVGRAATTPRILNSCIREVLRGAAEILVQSKPIIFFECIDAVSGASVRDILAAYGYTFFIVCDDTAQLQPVDNIEPEFEHDGTINMSRLIGSRFQTVAA